mmetsp:Transcript_150472/g.483642  ORF Transcript_150472/g.483642 Transcript_150472/m.483642 type:complete len:579 (-) Transcript_150472:33-1769(-)
MAGSNVPSIAAGRTRRVVSKAEMLMILTSPGIDRANLKTGSPPSSSCWFATAPGSPTRAAPPRTSGNGPDEPPGDPSQSAMCSHASMATAVVTASPTSTEEGSNWKRIATPSDLIEASPPASRSWLLSRSNPMPNSWNSGHFLPLATIASSARFQSCAAPSLHTSSVPWGSKPRAPGPCAAHQRSASRSWLRRPVKSGIFFLLLSLSCSTSSARSEASSALAQLLTTLKCSCCHAEAPKYRYRRPQMMAALSLFMLTSTFSPSTLMFTSIRRCGANLPESKPHITGGKVRLSTDLEISGKNEAQPPGETPCGQTSSAKPRVMSLRFHLGANMSSAASVDSAGGISNVASRMRNRVVLSRRPKASASDSSESAKPSVSSASRPTMASTSWATLPEASDSSQGGSAAKFAATSACTAACAAARAWSSSQLVGSRMQATTSSSRLLSSSIHSQGRIASASSRAATRRIRRGSGRTFRRLAGRSTSRRAKTISVLPAAMNTRARAPRPKRGGSSRAAAVAKARRSREKESSNVRPRAPPESAMTTAAATIAPANLYSALKVILPPAKGPPMVCSMSSATTTN